MNALLRFFLMIACGAAIAVAFSFASGEKRAGEAQYHRSSHAGENTAAQEKGDDVRSLENRLRKSSADIDRLRQQAENLSGTARVTMEKWIDELRKEKEALNRRLQRAGETASKAWGSIRDDLEQAMDDLEKDIRKHEAAQPGDDPEKLRYDEKEGAGPQGALPG